MSDARREALLEALDAYRAEERHDHDAIVRFRSFLERADPFQRADPDGHVTASAVVARPSGGEFLLVFHRKLDRWLQPGGHVEPDDASVFEAAVREAREETGVDGFQMPIRDAILDLDAHPIPAFGSEPAHVHYDVRFLLTAEDPGELAVDAAWFPFAAISSADPDGSLTRAIDRARARLA
jgi:8-oxo-dGTP pyrophosphatase MutT (NUDIX family)